MHDTRGALADAAESSVVALAMVGDEPAFAELVRRRQGATRGFLRRLCRDAALADDLAQESFVQAWRTLGSLREPAAFPGWLKRIALNAWLMHRRRGSLALEELDDEHHEQEGGATHDSAARLDLDAALGRLKPVERMCLVLCYQEGLSHSEAAAASGLPIGTVKSHVSRAAARVRELLDGYGGSHDV